MRECGILLPVSSLPSPYGIGAFSKEAYEFVRQLGEAGQCCWQLLPLGPTSYGDSPYQSFSAFAGNPYYIDLEELCQEGLLTVSECQEIDFGSDPETVDYKKIYDNRFVLLKKAYANWKKKGYTPEDAAQKLNGETREYCFFMALKDIFEGKSWIFWEEEIRLRKAEAMSDYRQKLSDEIGFYQFQQMKFGEQWKKLKTFANENGVRIIGDIPIYVAFDSADSWAHPELFQFDQDLKPDAVAGCPPDAFSSTGQLWGNPLYRWEYHQETGFDWWLRRMEYSFQLYDTVRVDHFRGFDEYYSIPAANETAIGGKWEKGPGIALFQCLEKRFGRLDIIAEDLGYLTPSVLELVRDTGFPGMKVLEFAFDSSQTSAYLPHNYTLNTVVYTGTHDNNTVRGWYEDMSEGDRCFAAEYMDNGGTKWEDIHWDFIRLALSSVARLAVIPMQDYLGLGREARINVPSTLGDNWIWRMKAGAFTDEIRGKCSRMARLYGRK